jgi:hypothetical protein
VTDAEYIEAGDRTIACFTGRGTNDGPLGPLGPSGRALSLPVCDVLRHEAGRIVRADYYYDQLSILVQLGHAEQTVAARS